MSKYIKISPYYTAGYIPESDYQSRINQGLDPQDFANACVYNEQNQPVNKNMNLYPAKQVQMSYGIPSIPNNCPCTDYIKAP